MTHNLKALRELEKRLAEARGPDRVSEIALFRLSGSIDEVACRDWCRQDGRTDLTRERYIKAFAPDYTASLDAAVALVERVLPGWGWIIHTLSDERWARVTSPDFESVSWNGDETKGRDASAAASTVPLALCLATVRALISQGEQ